MNLGMLIFDAALWLLYGLSLMLLLVTAIPMLRTGWWFVRGWEFPRLQLAAAGCMLILAIFFTLAARSFFTEVGWLAGSLLLVILLALAVVWQASHGLRYIGWWRFSVPSISPDQSSSVDSEPLNDFRMVSANLDKRNKCYAEVAEVLAAQNADVLLLIEIHDRWAAALSGLRKTYGHHTEQIVDDGLGIALWSRLPTRRMRLRYLVSEERASIHGEVQTPDGKWVSIVGIHPVPPGLRAGSWYERYDSRIRDAELLELAQMVAQAPGCSWLIAGDFNDVAWSQTTRRFERQSGLLDPRVGRRLLNTYHARYALLRYPLDHVYLSPGFEVGRLDRVTVPGSDHFGVVVELRVATQNLRAQPADDIHNSDTQQIIAKGREDAAGHKEQASQASE